MECADLQQQWAASQADALQLLKDDKVMLAEARFGALESHWRAGAHAGCDSCRDFVEGILNSVARTDLRARAHRVAAVRASVASDDGWILQRDADGIRTLYRLEPGNSHIILRAECDIDSPVLDILALFYEVDLYTRWMPTYKLIGLKAATILENPSPTKLLVHIVANVPWPMQTRDLCIAIDGVDCMDDGNAHRQIVVLLDSSEMFEGKAIPAPAASITRMEMRHGALILTPHVVNGGGTATRLQLTCAIDPKLPMIPDCLINFGVRHLAYMALDKMRKEIAALHGSELYAGRIVEHDAFYGFIRRRLEELQLPEHHAASIAAVVPPPAAPTSSSASASTS
eukprot:m.255438 g.255438  ORF g.255438 m.255438 type:complete len:342 (-) comp19481_c0_seq1:79-1104(-)